MSDKTVCSEPQIGQKVRLLKSIWDDGQDHHPPAYLAHKGEVLVVRAFDKGHEHPVCISHEYIIDRSFRVALDEIELLPRQQEAAVCSKCHHDQKFFYHRPESGDKEARCWHEDEDGFCGCKCVFPQQKTAVLPDHPIGFDNGSDVFLDLVLFAHGDEITIPYAMVRKFQAEPTRAILNRVNEDLSLTVYAKPCDAHAAAPVAVPDDKCTRCNGRGWYLERFSDNHSTPCNDCGGTGRNVVAVPESQIRELAARAVENMQKAWYWKDEDRAIADGLKGAADRLRVPHFPLPEGVELDWEGLINAAASYMAHDFDCNILMDKGEGTVCDCGRDAAIEALRKAVATKPEDLQLEKLRGLVDHAVRDAEGWVLFDAMGDPLGWPKHWPQEVDAAWLEQRGVIINL